MVPEKYVFVVERFGTYLKTLGSGVHLLIPGVDQIVYVHSLKEEMVPVIQQKALTNDGFIVKVDSVMYIKIKDPYLFSYAIGNAYDAVLQHMEMTVRKEIGKITLNKISEDMASLNVKIKDAINEAAENWGLKCIRYETYDIVLAQGMKRAMEMQIGSAMRAQIIESDGTQSAEEIREKAMAEAFQQLAYALADEGSMEVRWFIVVNVELNLLLLFDSSLA